jgi:Zn-dependent protease with chaperone function
MLIYVTSLALIIAVTTIFIGLAITADGTQEGNGSKIQWGCIILIISVIMLFIILMSLMLFGTITWEI